MGRRSSSWKRRTLAAIAGMCLAGGSLAIVAGVAPPAAATVTFTVDSAADPVAANPANCTTPVPGACTLRDAFAAASATADDVVIVVQAGLGTIVLSHGELSYDGGPGGAHALTINGNGVTIMQTTAGERVIGSTSDGALTLDHVTITGGNSNAAPGRGGGVESHGNLVLTNAVITANQLSGPDENVGGGAFSDGTITARNTSFTGNQISGSTQGAGAGLAAGGAITLTNSEVRRNHTNAAGGGLAGVSGGGIAGAVDVTLDGSTVADNVATSDHTALGGGISIGGGSLTSTNSTISGNAAVGAAGAQGGGALLSESATLTGTTVSGNTASNGGAAPTHAEGGGLWSVGTMTLQNSTVTGNAAQNTAAGATTTGGGVLTSGVELVYVTIDANAAGQGANIEIETQEALTPPGGGGFVFGQTARATAATRGSLTTFGSVISQPLSGGTDCNFEVPQSTISNGYNFADDASCLLTGTGDRQNAGDPGLGALGDNGGPTLTQLPATTSPLLDVIPPASCAFDGVTTDQRGISRPQGPGCDVGAVEVQVAPAPAPAPTPVAVVPRFTG